MNVAGLVPFTTIDFPDKLAAVVFFQGCPLKCPFCHNPDLQPFETGSKMSWSEVLNFLAERKKRLDGVVLSGGEPLMQPGIVEAAKQIKKMGFSVAIHTSGVYPNKVKELLPFIDWVGLDVKAPRKKYELLSGRKNIENQVFETLDILSQSPIDFEVRTTLDPNYLDIEDIYTLADELKDFRVKTYALQKYRTFPGDTNPPSVFETEKFFQDTQLIDFLKMNFPNLIMR